MPKLIIIVGENPGIGLTCLKGMPDEIHLGEATSKEPFEDVLAEIDSRMSILENFRWYIKAIQEYASDLVREDIEDFVSDGGMDHGLEGALEALPPGCICVVPELLFSSVKDFIPGHCTVLLTDWHKNNPKRFLGIKHIIEPQI